MAFISYKYTVFSLALILSTLGSIPVTYSQSKPISSVTKDSFYRDGKDFALFFAIEDYNNGWSKLRYPIADVEKISASLKELYGFKVEILKNSSRDEILDKLEEYRKMSFSGDAQLLVFFSGHGEYIEGTKEGFVIPREGKNNDKHQSSYISHDRLKKAVDAIPCNHILLAIDACFSGAIDDKIALRGEGLRPGENRVQEFIEEQLKYKSRLYITSGGIVPTPDKSEFAQKILGALKSTDSQSIILDFYKLCSFLIQAQPTPRMGNFGETEPGTQNFIFIRKTYKSKDSDGDLVLDKYDQCPDTFAKTASGCPDTDNDGTPDHLDRCKTEAGSIQNQGCPELDSDEDGTPDKADKCSQQAGPALLRGCPIPENMVLIEKDTFRIGDTKGDNIDSDEKSHKTIVRNYLVAKREVTFDEFDAFCDSTGTPLPSDNGWGRGKRPVINVSWYDAFNYCNWRSRKENLEEVYVVSTPTKEGEYFKYKDEMYEIKPDANGYRLPTEAEWEYAAREKGKDIRFGNGKDTANTKEINFDPRGLSGYNYASKGEYREKTTLVGSFPPNRLGLFDMSGNVQEWCQDWYKKNYRSNSVQKTMRTIRGGAWSQDASIIRNAFRDKAVPSEKNTHLGFRVVRTVGRD